MCVGTRLRTINVGGEEYVSIEELVEKLRVLIPESRSVVTLLPKEQANITNKRPDNTRAKQLLGHECRVSLDEGLPLTVEWQRRQYNVPAVCSCIGSGMDWITDPKCPALCGKRRKA